MHPAPMKKGRIHKASDGFRKTGLLLKNLKQLPPQIKFLNSNPENKLLHLEVGIC